MGSSYWGPAVGGVRVSGLEVIIGRVGPVLGRTDSDPLKLTGKIPGTQPTGNGWMQSDIRPLASD